MKFLNQLGMLINNKNYRTYLQVFSIALANGLMSKTEIIAWADKILEEENDFDDIVIELSLSKSKSTDEVVTMLNRYLDFKFGKLSARIALGMLHKLYDSRQISFKDAYEILCWLAWETELTQEEKEAITLIELDYQCAEDEVFGTMEDVETSVSDFLNIYREFELYNFDTAKKLSENIDKRINEIFYLIKKK